MKKIVKYIFLTAVKDWLFLGILFALLGVFIVSNLLGYSALAEENTVQMVVFASTSRLIVLMGMVVFVCFHINMSFENKEISFMLSKNISREKFIFSYWVGFNLISQLLLIPVIGLIIIFNSYNFLGFLQWFVSVSLELMLMTSFSIAVSFIIDSSVLNIFSCVGFYTISRMMNFFTDVVVYSGNSKIFDRFTALNQEILRFTCNLVPRLDLFSQTKWLVYGADAKTLGLTVLQTTIYLPILFLITFHDFRKKQF